MPHIQRFVFRLLFESRAKLNVIELTTKWLGFIFPRARRIAQHFRSDFYTVFLIIKKYPERGQLYKPIVSEARPWEWQTTHTSPEWATYIVLTAQGEWRSQMRCPGVLVFVFTAPRPALRLT